MTLLRSFLIAVLLAQLPDYDPQLERERFAAEGTPSIMVMVRLTAVHTDGSPARGSISCSGIWRKYDETEIGGGGLPFATDSTGSIILNPWIGDYEDDPLTCTALDKHGHQGSIRFTMPSDYQEITVR